jgi:hypothetical protein
VGVKLTGSAPVSGLMTSPVPVVNWMALKDPFQKPPLEEEAVKLPRSSPSV